MPTIKVVLIPADKTKPVQEVDYDQSDYKNLTALIFDGKRDGTFQRFSLDHGDDDVTFWYDDEGMFRLDNEELPDIINLRAMELVSHVSGGMPIQQIEPLIGDYVITGGADDEGDSLPAPAWIKDHPFKWQDQYLIMPKPEVQQ